MCFQLNRHLPYLVSLVCLILLYIYILIVLTAIWIALLVCLEHSFWITKKGSNPSDAFAKAWSFYFETQSALVNQELHDYLKSNSHKDWFTTYHHPSVEEWAKCKEIIFNNLLCKSHPFFLLFFYQAQEIVDISLARPTTSIST